MSEETHSTAGAAETALVSSPALFDEPTVEETPATTTEDQPTEGLPGEQPEADPEPEAAAGGDVTEETDEPSEAEGNYRDMLPAKQVGKGKDYAEELYSLAAKRFGYTSDDLADPVNGEKVHRALRKMIDSDIYIGQLAREQEVKAREAKPEDKAADDKEPKAEDAKEPVTWASLQTMADSVADAIVTPDGASTFAPAIFDDITRINEARESGDEKQIATANMGLTRTLTKFAVLLNSQLFPQMFHQLVSSPSTRKIFEPMVDERLEAHSLTDNQESALYDEAKDLLVKEPGYRDFTQLLGNGLEQTIDDYFKETGTDVLEMQFRGQDGNPLPPLQNAIAQYKFAVKLHRGANYQPADEQVRRAIEKGKQEAKRETARTNAGRLNSGKTSGRFEQPTSAVDDEMSGMIQSFDGANPLTTELASNRSR